MAGFGELENVNDSNGARAPIRSAWSGVKPTEEERRGDRHSFEDGHETTAGKRTPPGTSQEGGLDRRPFVYELSLLPTHMRYNACQYQSDLANQPTSPRPLPPCSPLHTHTADVDYKQMALIQPGFHLPD